MKKPVLAACLATAYLLVYILAFSFNAPTNILLTLFLLSPVVVVWMAVSILKDRSVEVGELEKDEEYGYQDRPKSTLRTF